MAAGSKKRLSNDRVVIDTIVGDVTGKDVIVLDDEIANGGTVSEIVTKLRARRVGRIAVACTHGLFTGEAIARLGAEPAIAENGVWLYHPRDNGWDRDPAITAEHLKAVQEALRLFDTDVLRQEFDPSLDEGFVVSPENAREQLATLR